MLILRRKAGEGLLIGSDIKVTVVAADEGGARLAIEAPKEIPVLRE
ncbi:carbon storage regulator, partial [Clostridiaceae bacterium]|nr:carbon storage regulator [Clostridiaceae bacterium]NBI84584.1 carbon storage regulator [Clostridiaceae bacterium]